MSKKLVGEASNPNPNPNLLEKLLHPTLLPKAPKSSQMRGCQVAQGENIFKP